MTIDPSSAAASLIAGLEARASLRPGKTAKSNGASTDAQDPSGRRSSLGDELARIADAMGTDDPEAYQRARRQAVNVLLRHRLGTQMREIPDWGDLVDRIATAIAADPDIDGRLAIWLQGLGRRSDKK